MAALLGLDAEAVRDLCATVNARGAGVLVLANDNCPGQNVISGDTAAVELALGLAKDAGARRAIKLAVSIASHSPLMSEAGAEFGQALRHVEIRAPQAPVYANTSASPLADEASIMRELEMQLTQPVRWSESVQAMADAGANMFVEVGPKDVLTGLVKRIAGTAKTFNLNSAANLDIFVSQVLQA
jgi:[acyl-carrier-protein] S-malonyltransferase